MFSSKKENAALRAENAALREALQRYAVIVAINREGSENHFTFVINGEKIVIKTYSTNFDEVEQWKKQLNLT